MSRRQLDNLSPDAARILRIWERSRPHAVRGRDASRVNSGSGWKRWRQRERPDGTMYLPPDSTRSRRSRRR